MEQMQLFPLSAEEVRDRGRSMAATMQRYNALEAEAKEIARRYRDDLKKLRGELSQLAEVVVHEQEWRVYVPPWQDGDDAE